MLIDIGILNNSTPEFACKSYTLKHKWLTVHGVETCIASGLSIKEACSLERMEKGFSTDGKKLKPSEGWR